MEAEQFVNEFQLVIDQLRKESENLDVKVKAEESKALNLKKEMKQVYAESVQTGKSAVDSTTEKDVLDNSVEKNEALIASLKKKIETLEFKIQETLKVLKGLEDDSAGDCLKSVTSLTHLEGKARLATEFLVIYALKSSINFQDELVEKKRNYQTKVLEMERLSIGKY